MAEFHEALLRRLQSIDDMGQNATRLHKQRFADQQQQAMMDAMKNRLSQSGGNSQRAASARPGGIFTTGRNNNARWEDFGLELQRLGYKVAENPDKRFGGKVGKHSKGSRHYSGRAFDVNWAPGTSKGEQEMLWKAVELAKQYNIPQSIFMQPGHYGHAHFGW